jgi:L-malate glycosyltransferase
MNILYFSRAYTTHDLRFVRELVGAGHSIRYLQLEDDGVPYVSSPLPPSVKRLNWAGTPGRRETPDKFLPLLPELDALVRRVKPDWVQAGPVLSCALLSALVGFRPLLTVSWGSDILVDTHRNAWNTWAARYVLERSDLFLCDCAPVKEKAQTIHPVPDHSVLMFPWGIELPRYRQTKEQRCAMRTARGWDDCCIVISTRAWHHGYGIDRVIESFAAASSQERRLRLLLLGTGPAADEVCTSIERYSLSEVVHCPGQVPEMDMVAMLGMADIYICCTPSDGTSVSLLEAMAMRLPAVVTDNAGNRQWVDESCGVRVPQGSVSGFSQALLELAHDPGKRERLGEAARNIVESHADWNKNIPVLLGAYER